MEGFFIRVVFGEVVFMEVVLLKEAEGTGDRESVNFPKTREKRGSAHPPIREIMEEMNRKSFSDGVARVKNLKKEIGGEEFINIRNIDLFSF